MYTLYNTVLYVALIIYFFPTVETSIIFIDMPLFKQETWLRGILQGRLEGLYYKTKLMC